MSAALAQVELTPAQWWRREAETSANRATCIFYAENLERIEADKLARPDHWRRMPPSAGDGEWIRK